MVGTEVMFGGRGNVAAYSDANQTRVFNVGNCFVQGGSSMITTANEVQAQTKSYAAGTWSMWGTQIRSPNSRTTTTTFGPRINGTNGSASVSVTTGATGHFQDNINTDAVAINDLLDNRITTLSGSQAIIPDGWESKFTRDSSGSATVFTICCNGNANLVFSTASQTYYIPITGGFEGTSTNTVELNRASTKLRVSGSLVGLQLVITGTNGRSTATTVTMRKGGATQTMSVSIAGAATGYMEDAVNTETVAPGDIWKYIIVTGTGTGNTNMSHISTWCLSSGSKFDMGSGRDGNGNLATINVDNFYSVSGGRVRPNTVESVVYQVATFSYSATNLRCTLSNNSATNSPVLSLSLGGSSGSLSVSITNNTTGDFEDTGNTDGVTIGDTMSLKHTGANNATWVPTNMMISGDPGSGIIPGNGPEIHHYNSVILG